MKKLLAIQVVILFVGTIFAWFNVVQDFTRFYRIEGTLFKVRDCSVPNPVTEACFYGAIAFLIAFIVAEAILLSKVSMSKERYLLWFLIASTVFAWSNVMREFSAFYYSGQGVAIGCSAVPIVNPYSTPCFTGASIFLIATIFAAIIQTRINRKII